MIVYSNKINLISNIKFFYHFLVFLLLLYIVFIIKINDFIKFFLLIIAFFHLYDSWWFANYTDNAPI